MTGAETLAGMQDDVEATDPGIGTGGLGNSTISELS